MAALSFLDTSAPVALTLTSDTLALLALALLALPAILVIRARDARRFVLGVLGAAVLWLLLWYPNLAALPLPSGIASLYQGLLPTWNWDFQFGVNTDPAFEGGLVDAGTLVIGGTASCSSSASPWRRAGGGAATRTKARDARRPRRSVRGLGSGYEGTLSRRVRVRPTAASSRRAAACLRPRPAPGRPDRGRRPGSTTGVVPGPVARRRLGDR